MIILFYTIQVLSTTTPIANLTTVGIITTTVTTAFTSTTSTSTTSDTTTTTTSISVFSLCFNSNRRCLNIKIE